MLSKYHDNIEKMEVLLDFRSRNIYNISICVI